ncbi:MAG: YdbC family protein [Planifilum fimeticola]|jgi:hypothetical protein
MLIKWIVCQVPENRREAFSRAQCAWKAIRDVDGLYGQWGGWNVHRPAEAGILALWRDCSSHDAFMSQVHDSIFHATKQEHTYKRLSVTLLEGVSSLPEEREALRRALTSRWICVSDDQLHPERVDFLMREQPSDRHTAENLDGDVAALFTGRELNGPDRCLSFTLWRSRPDLESVRDCRLFRLQEEWLV